MAKFRIESQITLLAVVIAAAVITSGFFAWKSLSSIVNSIHREARPDNRLFLVKDINNDLSAVENNVRLYLLTESKNNQNRFDTLKRTITSKLQSLVEITPPENEERALVDSFRTLVVSKVQLWQGMLELHREAEQSESGFSDIYEQLEEQKFDTITETTVKKGIFRSLFGNKKIITDTTIVERNLEKDTIRQQIEKLQKEIKETDKKVNLLESNLIAENIVITTKINRLITQAEQNEARSLMEETHQADRLAAITYKRLAGFSIAAVLLLLVVLFLLYNYLKKMRIYEHGLKKARQEAENLAIAKEKFAANVSHEMRTPVNAIYGLAEQMLNYRNDNNLDEKISILAQSARHLKNIINDTLDFTKIQANKIKFDVVHFSPAAVLGEVIKLQQYNATRKNVALISELSDTLPGVLVGDPLRLKQILINLIGNAVKFTEEGEITLRAAAEKKAEDIYDLKMEIADTGIGISKENLEIIFEEFVQAENTQGKKYQGTGLGLAIVKKLVELQDGNINIESEPGAGTTVTVVIPYPEGEEEKITEYPTESPEIPRSFEQINILVADDEEFNRYIFKMIFNKWKIKYTEAVNGEEAEEAAIRDDYDIVLMDVRMPKKNGLEATRAILREKPETIIIAITATSDEKERKKCLEAGMKGFLTKPFSETELFQVISSVQELKAKPEKSAQKEDYLKTMEQLANNDPVFMREMIFLFIGSTENAAEKIETAIGKKDWVTVSDFAHKIAPQCKQIGNKKLYGNIKDLEISAAKNPVDENTIILVFGEIKTKIAEINLTLKEFLDWQNNKISASPPKMKNN